MSINHTAITFPGPTIAASLTADARHFQIATLASLLVLHVVWFDLGATPLQAAITIAAAIATQYAFSRLPGALRHPYSGPAVCEAGATYRNGLPLTLQAQAHTLAEITGWEIGAIRQRMRETGQQF